MNSPERSFGNGEKVALIERAAAERSAELSRKPKTPETRPNTPDHKESLNAARREAIMAVETPTVEKVTDDKATAFVPPESRKDSYKKTMSSVQSQMSKPSRQFSKVIHNPAVEKAAQTIGSTIARPNAIVSGSFCAFVAVSIIYIVARRYGYPLSGSETIATFVIGWILGILYDYLRLGISRRS